MFGTHRARDHCKTIAVADVGNDGAAIAILCYAPGAPSRVIASERAVLPVADRSQAAVASGVAAQIVIAGDAIQKKYSELPSHGYGRITELSVILHAPLIRPKTVRDTYLFSQDKLVTNRMIAELAEKTLNRESGIDKKNILEASVVRIELNGYPCSRPHGKYATSLSICALVSEVAPDVRTEIESALKKTFPHHVPVFRSAVRASMTVLQEILGKEKDYFIVDMASEGTTMTSIRDGAATEHETTAEGVHTIVKRIAASGLPEESMSMLRMLERDQCSEPACDAIRTAVANVEPTLVRIFGECMVKCVTKRRLPNTLVLIAHPDLLPWLSKFFSRIDFAQFTTTTRPFFVQTLDAQDMGHFVRPDDGVVLDLDLALACGFVNISQHNL